MFGHLGIWYNSYAREFCLFGAAKYEECDLKKFFYALYAVWKYKCANNEREKQIFYLGII